MSRSKRLFACACVLAAAVSSAGAAPAVAQRGDIEAQLEQAGDRLQVVTEEYNEARIRRAALDSKLAQAQGNLLRSKSRLAAERKKLGVAVRDLYMHPAGGMDAFFQARSFSELERGRRLGGHVALSADDLILKIRKARAESESAAARFGGLRDAARKDELAIAARQRDAASALARSRALLARTNSSAREAARRASLGEAAAFAAENISFVGKVRSSAMTAVSAAASQMGKPYRWGGAGPNSFDCSGLTMWAWARGGVSLPHSSRAQYASLQKVPMSQLAPGDLVFRGNPIHHVGIYRGGGVVIAAPRSGETVREGPVSGYTMAARP